jgi:hypothetical protein
VTLKGSSTADDVRRQADLLGRYVDAIQVTDNPYAWVQMSALSASSLLLAQGVDPPPGFCRPSSASTSTFCGITCGRWWKRN